MRAFLREVGGIAIAVAIALLVRVFLLDSFRIPSTSMLPTLLIGDHLFVDKLAYGPSIPYTGIRLPGRRLPRRGDVVVFRAARDGHGVVPADRRPDLRSEDFVKRVIGIPGDTVEVRSGVVKLNGRALESQDLGATFEDPEQGLALARRSEMLEGCRHEILDNPRTPGPEIAPYAVEPGRYFVMGDNRDNSYDSRLFGTVRLQEIKGPAWILYFSWDYNGGWLGLLNPLTWWQADTRWDRIGDRLGCQPSPAPR